MCEWSEARKYTVIQCFITKQHSTMGLVMNTVAVIIMVVLGSHQTHGYKKCEADHECNPEQYCYRLGSTCTDCVDCAYLKREKSSVKSCAQTALECGPCISGFQEELFNEGKRLYCIPNAASTPETTAFPYVSGDTSAYVSVLAAIGVVTILVIFLVVLGCIWYHRKKIHTRDDAESPVSNQSPPPYEEGGTQIPLLPTAPFPLAILPPELGESSFSVNISHEKNEDVLTQANPFQRAQDPYHSYCTGTSDDEGSLHSILSDAGDNPPSPNLAGLFDEDTMPSNWTPGTEYVHINLPPPITEELNDSGLSMPSSHTASTSSLTDSVGQIGQRTIVVFSALSAFAGISAAVAISNSESSTRTSSNRRRRSPEHRVPVKRIRQHLSSIVGTGSDSDDESHPPDASSDKVMDSSIAEDLNDSEISVPSNLATSTAKLTDPMGSTARGTVETFPTFTALTGTIAAAVNDKESPTARVPTNQCQQSPGSRVAVKRVGQNLSSAKGTEDLSSDESSQTDAPPLKILERRP